MIASKLILFFCFCLLLLDNSLGKAPELQRKNQKLFAEALEYGVKYEGELREQGLEYKQLLQEIALAEKKVGFHQDQLKRLNDATREVGYAKKDVDYYKKYYRMAPIRQFRLKLQEARRVYAEKVSRLVAVRVLDIGKDKKALRDLEKRKVNLMLSMVDAMAVLKEQWKKKNIKKKVKEAKENGVTEEDIQDILFADFFESGGVSLLAGGEGPDAVLESFRKGVQSILDETYNVGIIEYGNSNGKCAPVNGGAAGGDCGAAGGNDGAAGGNDGASGGNNGASGGASGGSGGDDNEGPRKPKGGPGNSTNDDGDSEENDDDREENKRQKMILKQFQGMDDDENPIETFELDLLGNIGDDELEIELAGSNVDANDSEEDDDLNENIESEGFPNFSDNEQSLAGTVVNLELVATQNQVYSVGRRVSRLLEEQVAGYEGNASLQVPSHGRLNQADTIALYERRILHMQGLISDARRWLTEAQHLNQTGFEQYELAIANAHYYGRLLARESGYSEPYARSEMPAALPGFRDFEGNYRMRFLISTKIWNRWLTLGPLVTQNLNDLQMLLVDMETVLNKYQLALESEKRKSTPGSSSRSA